MLQPPSRLYLATHATTHDAPVTKAKTLATTHDKGEKGNEAHPANLMTSLTDLIPALPQHPKANGGSPTSSRLDGGRLT